MCRGAGVHVASNLGGDLEPLRFHGELLEIALPGAACGLASSLAKQCTVDSVAQAFFASVPSSMYWTSSFLIGQCPKAVPSNQSNADRKRCNFWVNELGPLL